MTQRKECGANGGREYLGLTRAIRFCSSYDRSRMACNAAEGCCRYQYQIPHVALIAVQKEVGGED